MQKNSGFKKSLQKFMGSVGNNLEVAVNLRSAPGGRHWELVHNTEDRRGSVTIYLNDKWYRIAPIF